MFSNEIAAAKQRMDSTRLAVDAAACRHAKHVARSAHSAVTTISAVGKIGVFGVLLGLRYVTGFAREVVRTPNA